VLALSLVYAFAVTMTGHAGAGAGQHPVRVAVETLHIGAAMIWVGVMVATPLALRRLPAAPAGAHPIAVRVAVADLRRAVLARFGLVAAACVAILAGTGMLLTGSGVASVDAAIGSTYGRLLLIKLGLTGLTLAAAAVTAVAMHPGLAPARLRPAVGGLSRRRVLAVETVLAGAVLLSAAALGSAQPAVGGVWRPVPTAQPIVSGTAGDLVEALQIAPNLPGRNFVTLDIYDSRRPAPAPIGSVLVGLTGPGGRTASAVATGQGDGRWLLPTDALTAPGRWSVDVSVTRVGYPAATQTYGWVVTDPTVRPRPTVISSRPLAPLLEETAIALIGLGTLIGLGGLIGRRGRAQARGRRRVSSAPPSGARPADAEPPNASATAATSASPSPVPGSSPTG
jgi:copper transport protein